MGLIITPGITIYGTGSFTATGPAASTYAISSNVNSVDEGSTVRYTITTTGVAPDTTLYWTNSGNTTIADFAANVNSGSFVINSSGTGTVDISPINDLLTEGSQSIEIQVRTDSLIGNVVATATPVVVLDTSLTPVPTYAVSANVASINEGSAVLFTITTTNVNNGTTLYWTNSGNTAAGDFTDSLNSGSFTINSNNGTVTRALTNDAATEGAETIIFNVRTVSTSGTIVATSSTITVGDTSQAAAGLTATYLVVAGGGASGGRGSTIASASGYAYGAGGGAGGVRQGSVTITPGTPYTITIGGGGSVTTSGTLGSQRGGNGTPTTLIGTGVSLTSTGGGGGGGASPSGNGSTGGPGGSGGGGAVWRPTSSSGTITGYAGGTGNTPPTTPSQGNGGGSAPPSGPPSFFGSAGGGGAGGTGANGVRQAPPSPTSGISAGGVGITSTITGSNTLVGGGGQGGGWGSYSHPAMNFGGGGSNSPQLSGVANTGGGGASSTNGSNAGGSGLVIIKTSTEATAVTGTYTTGPDLAGNVWYRFTQSGTITF